MSAQPYSGNSPGVGQFGNAQNVAELLQGAGMAGSAGFAPIGADTLVYMGPDYADPADKTGKSGMMPVDTALNEFYRLDDQQYARWVQNVSASLGWDATKAPERIQSSWNSYVQQASAYQKATGEAISPFQLIELNNARMARLGMLPGQKAGSGGAGGPRKIIDFTNEMDAEMLIDNAMSQALGREANDAERETFYQSLNKLAAQNPRVATAMGTKGGINQQLAAKQFAESQGGAAEFTAASDYAAWMQDVLMRDTTLGATSGLR